VILDAKKAKSEGKRWKKMKKKGLRIAFCCQNEGLGGHAGRLFGQFKAF